VIRRCKLLLVVAAVLACIAIAAVPELENYLPIRTVVRWLVWSRAYKTKAMAQRVSETGDLKHIEWDGWGWAGEDTTLYLVFDPTDSLSVAAKNRSPGKFSGIPCEVFRVRRLESHWYTAQFYTNEFWGRRNALNCTGSGD